MTNSLDAMTRARREADLTLWLPGDVPMWLRRIPAAPGGFLMGERRGDEDDRDGRAEPVHRVVIDREFYLGTYPVTQGQYRAVAAEWRDLNLDGDPSHFKGDDRPVERVSWEDAVTWCDGVRDRWRDLRCVDREGRDARVVLDRFGLPSEAEWEYACRGGSRGEYSNGDGAARLRRVGWFNEEGGKGSTQAVGEKLSNAFGLHDMHGNVWEWCADVWDARAYRKREAGWVARPWTLADAGADAENPDRPIRVVRGGAWNNTARWCRSAFRYRWGPVNRDRNLGFRVCLVHGPASSERQTSGAKAKPDAEAEGQGAPAGGQAT